MAFGEVVVEGRALALAERRVLVEHVQDRAKRSPEYRSLCRAAASTLNGLVGRRFAALEISERIDLIARHGLAGRGVEPADDLDPSAKMRPLRTRIAPDLIRGYYASAAGWAVVGYQTFPGRCGELTRYTRPET